MKTAITLGLLAFMGRIGSITGLSSESLSIESAGCLFVLSKSGTAG